MREEMGRYNNSAAFDTVDHKILLQRLSRRFGINGKALRWFKSYLENRKQVVKVKGATSCSKDLRWESVLRNPSKGGHLG